MAEFSYTEALAALARDASVDLGRLLAAACPPGCCGGPDPVPASRARGPHAPA